MLFRSAEVSADIGAGEGAVLFASPQDQSSCAHLKRPCHSSAAPGQFASGDFFSEASAVRQLVQASEADWRQVFRAVRMWRARAGGHERDADQLARQGEELERLDIENESLGRQSRQMLLSLQQAQAELQWSLAEVKHLQEKEAEYEGQIMSASERNAALAGHNNSKQKIKHVVSLKEQIDNLRLLYPLVSFFVQTPTAARY